MKGIKERATPLGKCVGIQAGKTGRWQTAVTVTKANRTSKPSTDNLFTKLVRVVISCLFNKNSKRSKKW